MRTDALLAADDQMDSLEHLGKRHAGMLEHGADLHSELRAALAALLEAVTNDAVGVLHARLAANARQIIDATADHAAMRADNAIRPNDAFEESEGLGFVVKVRGRENRHVTCSVEYEAYALPSWVCKVHNRHLSRLFPVVW